MNVVRGFQFPALVVAIVGFSGAWPAAESQGQPAVAGGSIAGAWTLNADLSDKPRAPGSEDGREGGRRGGAGRGGMGGGFGGMRGGGRGRGGQAGPADREATDRQRDAMRDVMNAPDRLTIVQTETMVIITTGDGRVTRLSPDGKKIRDDNTQIERKTKWDAGKLVSEISGLGNRKITETYTIDPERRALLVTIAMDQSRANAATIQHRVYDPTGAR